MTDLRKYKLHRASALRRGIEFDLTFDEWMQIWTDSGHYHQRGRKRDDYVMSRYGDSGSYSVANVFIQRQVDNLRESNARPFMLERLTNLSIKTWNDPAIRTKHKDACANRWKKTKESLKDLTNEKQ